MYRCNHAFSRDNSMVVSADSANLHAILHLIGPVGKCPVHLGGKHIGSNNHLNTLVGSHAHSPLNSLGAGDYKRRLQSRCQFQQ